MGKTHKSTGKVANTTTNVCFRALRSGLSGEGRSGKASRKSWFLQPVPWKRHFGEGEPD